jgi:hypothetical protein
VQTSVHAHPHVARLTLATQQVKRATANPPKLQQNHTTCLCHTQIPVNASNPSSRERSTSLGSCKCGEHSITSGRSKSARTASLLDAEQGPSRWIKKLSRYTDAGLRLGAGMRGNGVGRRYRLAMVGYKSGGGVALFGCFLGGLCFVLLSLHLHELIRRF